MMKYRPQNGPQQRQRWSIDETETLINLIDKYGCSWVTILKKGHGVFAETRDQVSTIVDLGSINGVVVNGKRVKRHVLTHSDQIALGEHVLTYLVH